MEKIVTITKCMPKFSSGIILQADKLQNLADQTLLLPSLMAHGYTDGVVSGLDIIEKDGNIVVSKGVVRVHGAMFLMDEEMAIQYQPTNRTTFLKLCYLERVTAPSGTTHTFTLGTSETVAGEDEIELCRFKLQEGARLRYVYDDFEDLNTEFDTINIIRAVYSGKDSPALNIKILKIFAKEMLSLKPVEGIDTFFCIQILGMNDVMHMEGVLAYLEIKTGESLDVISNYKVYKGLLGVLQQERSKTRVEKKKKIVPQKKIFID